MLIDHEGPCCACIHHLARTVTPALPTYFPPRRAREDQIAAAVASVTRVTFEQVCGESRDRNITFARHLAMYLMFEEGIPKGRIGQALGNRDHSTVFAGIKRIRGEIGSRPETLADYEAAKRQLQESRR